MIEKRPDADKRRALGMLSGYSGIICNLLLCAVKFILGAFTGAVSVTADAVNNLTDASVNVVTLVGTKVANKPVDEEHPFGHGRAEYISALIVALSVFLMSFELAKSAVIKLFHPEKVKYSAVYMIILIVAICVKLWMAYFNSKLYILTDNLNMKAVMKDSLGDCAATFATLCVLILGGRYHILWLDGAIGIAVSVFVFFSGVSVIRDILGPLLGEPPSKELTDALEDIILENDLILGVHDLIVHNYGSGRIIASAHAEVPSDSDLMTVHDVIDGAEKKIMREYNIDICIHTDPVITNDDEQEKYKTLTEILISRYNADFTFHDFRLIKNGEKRTLSFDLVIPFEYEGRKDEIKDGIYKIYRDELPDINLRMNIEHSYTK